MPCDRLVVRLSLPFANMSNPAFCFRTFLARCVDREPVVVLSCVLGGIGLGMPVVVPPMRRAMGLDAHQVSCERKIFALLASSPSKFVARLCPKNTVVLL